MALVWGASKPLTLTLAAATALAGLVPAAQAYTAKLLINAIVRAIFIHLNHAPDRMVLVIPLLWGALRLPTLTVMGVVIVLAAIQLLIAAFSSLLQTLSNISQQLLQERVSMRVQLLIMERASTLDLTFFEDSQSYDTLQMAQREAIDELHGDEVRTITLTNLIDMRDVRMIEGSGRGRFLLKSPHPIGMGGHL